MGRKPAPRANYRNDAIVIHRIASAVEEDDRSSLQWKQEVGGHLQAAIKLLLEHKFPAATPVPRARKAG
jgi:hypothetical protein